MYTGDTQILTLMFRIFKNKFYPFSVNLFCFYNKNQGIGISLNFLNQTNY